MGNQSGRRETENEKFHCGMNVHAQDVCILLVDC